MAANIMEMLKQIQRDQKEYTKNLIDINRNINDKFNVIDSKIVDLDKKIDQQQVLVTIERLEQLVKKNNMVLFGNDETEINIEDKMLYNSQLDDAKKTDSSVETQKVKENPEAIQFQDSTKIAIIEDIERDSKEENQNTGQLQNGNGDKLQNLMSTVIRDFDAKTITPIEEATACAVCCKHGTVVIPPNCMHADQINQLNNKLNGIANIYQSDMRDLKELIKDLAVTSNDSITKITSIVRKLEGDKTVAICDKLNHIAVKIQEDSQETVNSMEHFVTAVKMLTKGVTNIIRKDSEQISIIETNIQSEMREMKELIKDFVARKIPEESVSTFREQKTVQISPAYFSTNQTSKLNSDLKRIAEMYYATNIFPIIEVVPGAADDHPVMKQLRKGVYYEELNGSDNSSMIKLKLGACGFQSSDIIDLITDYPSLSFNEVIREWLKRSKTRQEHSKKYDFTKPMIYNKNGNLVRLTL